MWHMRLWNRRLHRIAAVVLVSVGLSIWNLPSAYAASDACSVLPFATTVRPSVSFPPVSVSGELAYGAEVNCVGLDPLRQVSVTAHLYEITIFGLASVADCDTSSLSSQFVGAYTETLTCPTVEPNDFSEYFVTASVTYQKSMQSPLSQSSSLEFNWGHMVCPCPLDGSWALLVPNLCTIVTYGEQVTPSESIDNVTVDRTILFGARAPRGCDALGSGASGSVTLTNRSTNTVVATCELTELVTGEVAPSTQFGCIVLDPDPGLHVATSQVSEPLGFSYASGVAVFEVV